MSASQGDPHTLLPLPHLEFQTLVSLADTELHGYAIVKEIGARSEDSRTPSTGSLYLAIARLLKNGLIHEVGHGNVDTGGRKKRVYGLTDFGRSVAQAETERLGELARLADERLRGSQPQTSAGPRSQG